MKYLAAYEYSAFSEVFEKFLKKKFYGFNVKTVIFYDNLIDTKI